MDDMGAIDLHNTQPLSWPNTVQLTLSIQNPSEISLLFEQNALPAIEYLNITIQNLNTNLPSDVDISAPNIQLSKDSLRQTAIGSAYLKHLLLRYITLNDVIILIGSLIMPLLEELILINMYDNTLDRFGQFQEICNSTYLPSLKTLHFSLCFPQEIEHAWRMSSFNCNRQWPFDNINSYIDECYMRPLKEREFIPKIVFVIYNCPTNLLYRHKQYFHNYGFGTHVSAPIRTTQRRFVQWTCDQKYDAEQLNKTLQIVASGQVNELRLTYLNERTNTSMMSKCDSHWNLSLNHIRSITFNIRSDSIHQCERVAMIEQILGASPNLSSLVIAWRDFRHCSRKYFNLKYVHLLLSGKYKNPKHYFDIRRLNELVPHLYTLETSDSVMMLNKNLIEFILNISHQFNQLVHLVLNKNCLNGSRDKKELKFRDRLIAASHDQIFHGYNMRFRFYGYDELRFWF
ncbi:unnamed protein product [Adineta steineri]|uniref:F-box domain-containing protein n=2 Tax=Adineta steineri TaxID=433720 RepID=A0A819R0S4_9BILA|nr:unnamed protein product [Adineta steineri]